MKKNAIIVLCLLFTCFSSHLFAEDVKMNDTLKTIFSRKSVRTYANTPISQEQLMMLVKAGMAAPTAVDRRPWDFIVITDKPTLKKLADLSPHAKMTEFAAAAIVVTGDLDQQFGGKDSTFWLLDCSAATENILLAAESMKLGAVWTAVYPDPQRIEVIRTALKIPDHVVPLNLIPIGVPAGDEKPKDKFDPKKIHQNTW